MFRTITVGVIAAGLAFLAGNARGPSEKQVCLDSVEPILEVLADEFGDGTLEYEEIEEACEIGVRQYIREARDADSDTFDS